MDCLVSIRELRNGKKYNTAISISMSESNFVMSAPEGNVGEEFEMPTLTQEEIDEQIRTYIAPD